MGAQLQRSFGADTRTQLKSASVPSTSVAGDLDGMREEMGKEGLKLWESAYKLRPAPSKRPSEWSVDDLCWMLEQRGLGNCSDRWPFYPRGARSRACEQAHESSSSVRLAGGGWGRSLCITLAGAWL